MHTHMYAIRLFWITIHVPDRWRSKECDLQARQSTVTIHMPEVAEFATYFSLSTYSLNGTQHPNFTIRRCIQYFSSSTVLIPVKLMHMHSSVLVPFDEPSHPQLMRGLSLFILMTMHTCMYSKKTRISHTMSLCVCVQLYSIISSPTAALPCYLCHEQTLVSVWESITHWT